MYKTKQITLSALFLSIGLILPFFTGQIQVIGNQLLPMHIPVLLCGYFVGAPYGLIVGFILPLLRFFLFGMPLITNAICMSFELATYGFISGYFYRFFHKTIKGIYISLVIAMFLGRMVWGLMSFLILGLDFTFSMFISAAFFNAIVGIAIQLLFIPLLVMTLKKN